MLLLELVEGSKEIIENKCTNAVTTRQKEEAWERVGLQFNALTTDGIQRTDDQLKNCYQNIKKSTKKKISQDKVNLISITGFF